MTLNFSKFFQSAELKKNKLITRFSANQPSPQKNQSPLRGKLIPQVRCNERHNMIAIRLLSLLILIITSAIGAPVIANGRGGDEEISRPNILFILTDDQGYADLSCNGHPFVKTPHMDKICRESVRLENFHVAPSCSPSRAGLLTGMHEFKSGVTHTKAGLRQQLSHDRKTIAEYLKMQGYATALFNKWHLGGPSPNKRGFDHYLQTRSAPPRETNFYWDPKIVINGNPPGDTVKGFSPDIVTDELLKTMENHVTKGSGKPFCYFLWTVTPHAPVMAPEKYLKRFEGKMTDEEARYCAMVDNIDDNVGRIMAKLKELNVDEDTLVILMNDNGGTAGVELYNAGMRGSKASVWPGGTRAFSYWRWPGTLTPRTEEALTGYVDVAPTLAEIGGLEFPKEVADEMDGHSLLSLLKSPDGKFPRDRLLFKHAARWESGFAEQHKYIQAAVHQRDFLAIRIDPSCSCSEGVCVRARAMKKGRVTSMVYTSTKESTDFHWANTDGWELYNVKKDPACQNNLAESQPERTTLLTRAYESWWAEVFPKLMERGGDAPLMSNKAK